LKLSDINKHKKFFFNDLRLMNRIILSFYFLRK